MFITILIVVTVAVGIVAAATTTATATATTASASYFGYIYETVTLAVILAVIDIAATVTIAKPAFFEFACSFLVFDFLAGTGSVAVGGTTTVVIWGTCEKRRGVAIRR